MFDRRREVDTGQNAEAVVATLCEPSAHTVYLASVSIPLILADPHLMSS
jgi:hypothetical protein